MINGAVSNDEMSDHCMSIVGFGEAWRGVMLLQEGKFVHRSFLLVTAVNPCLDARACLW